MVFCHCDNIHYIWNDFRKEFRINNAYIRVLVEKISEFSEQPEIYIYTPDNPYFTTNNAIEHILRIHLKWGRSTNIENDIFTLSKDKIKKINYNGYTYNCIISWVIPFLQKI